MFKNQISTLILLFGMLASAQTNTDSSLISSKLTSDGQILQSVYLIGDAGALTDKEKHQTHTKNLRDFFIKNSKSNDYLIFLGDNIYPNGLPKKDDKNRTEAEKVLDLQVEIAKAFKGKSIFIPGNHDYYSGGSKAVERQMKYLQKALNKKSFAPADGCPVERLEVNDDLVILFVDSQWYITDWDHDPNINRTCEDMKTREDFFDEIDDAINDYQNQTLIIAMHHPVASYGLHGGRFSLNKHLFPIQSNIPLPVIGTAVSLARSAGGVSPQDLQSKKYRELSRRLITMASGMEKVIIASGHDHNQQYITDRNFHQVISGSGSKNAPAFDIGFSKFADQSLGFAKIDILPNRASALNFYSTEGTSTELLFSSSIYTKDQVHDKTYAKVPSTPVKASIYTEEEIEKSNVYTSLWGEHYRHLYGIPVEVPQLDLNTYRGGLKILKEGGGNQSNSLRVQDQAGIKYSLRAMKKDATRLLQRVVFQDVYLDNKFDNTASEELILDFFTASHPYAFLAIEDMAEHLGVYHTTSKLFYLPKQDALGNYNESYGDALYMLEERPDEDYENPSGSYGQPDDIEDTQDLFARLQRDEKYIVDENSYIRARILDMLIGDFDRHIDQWDWAEFKTDSGDRIFKPIPQDRDQAFAKFDGGVLNLLRTLIPFARMYPVYGDEIKHTDWFNNNVINLDRTILSQTSKEDWLREVDFIQQQLTDQKVEEAFAKMPQEIQSDRSTTELKNLLIARRDNLKNIIEKYHDYFSELVVVTGTNKDDFFDIERKENGITHLKVYRNKQGERAEKITDRIVDAKATKEVWVYGLDDTDTFTLTGNPKGKHVKVRLIGGFDEDSFSVENKRKLVIHDYKDESTNIEGKLPKVRKSDRYNINFFDYSKNNLNTLMVLPSIGANPDTGFNAGVNIT
ncbi:MAG: metallophosphoesterase, partial [Flavobacteriaceae bacterium]|nr:metallophosphoesterase [Flavobacteriaceae bacterium]